MDEIRICESIEYKLVPTLIIDNADHVIRVNYQGSVSFEPYFSWTEMGATEGGPDYRSKLITKKELLKRIDFFSVQLSDGEKHAIKQFIEKYS